MHFLSKNSFAFCQPEERGVTSRSGDVVLSVLTIIPTCHLKPGVCLSCIFVCLFFDDGFNRYGLIWIPTLNVLFWRTIFRSSGNKINPHGVNVT